MDAKPLVQSRTSSYMSWVGMQTQSTLKTWPTTVKAFWLESHGQARSDFRTRSGRGCLWILVLIWFSSLTAVFVFLCVFSTWANDYALPSACLPDDSFNLQPNTYQYWSNSGFFQITLGFGHLTFTQAKAIDVIWDIVVGRGGQGLLALLSWQAFVQYVTTSMEIQPVTFNTYRTIFLQNESLILAIPRIIQDFSRRRGLHSRFAMVFIVLTMMFVLIFPTLGSAMTGYSGNVEAYVPDSAGNNIRFSSFRPLYYVIHDGSRINLTDDYEVLATQEAGDPVMDSMFNWVQRARYNLDTDCNKISESYYRDKCSSYERIYNVSAYVGQYRTSRNVTSTFAGVEIGAPLLNITSYYTSWGLRDDSFSSIPQLNYTMWLNASGPAVDQAYTRSWTASGEHFSKDTIEANGVCQATKDYQWGFSFIQLIIMTLLLWLWTIGTTTLWSSSKLAMKQRGRDAVAGEYKAVFELADAMHAQLADAQLEAATHARSLSESQLRHRITKELRGGAIAYDTALLPEHDGAEQRRTWTLGAWARREAWWLAALVTSVVIDIFSVRAFALSKRGDLFFFFALPGALGFAMYIGTTHASRAMVLVWTALVVCVVPAVVLAVVVQSSMQLR